MIGPLEELEVLEMEDFMLLEKFTLASGGQMVAEQVDEWEIEHADGKCVCFFHTII